MAFHSKSEIAALTGKSIAHVSVNCSRGALIMSGDHIDDTIPQNAAKIKKWKADEEAKAKAKAEENVKSDKNSAKKSVKKSVKKNENTDKTPKKIDFEPGKPNKNEQVKANFTEPPPPDFEEEDYSTLDNRKKLMDIKFKESQIRKSELEAQKLRGEAIPTVMITAILSNLGSSFQNSYKNGAESLMMDLTHKHKIPPDAVAILKGKLIELINESHKKAIKTAKNDLKNAISEVAVKK